MRSFLLSLSVFVAGFAGGASAVAPCDACAVRPSPRPPPELAARAHQEAS